MHRRMPLVPPGGHRPPTHKAEELTGRRIPPPAHHDSGTAARDRDLNNDKDRTTASQGAGVSRALLAQQRRDPPRLRSRSRSLVRGTVQRPIDRPKAAKRGRRWAFL